MIPRPVCAPMQATVAISLSLGVRCSSASASTNSEPLRLLMAKKAIVCEERSHPFFLRRNPLKFQ